jgi:zinc transport system ATP-binding protein
MAQLTCRGLTLGYDGRKVAQGIDFSVNKGDYLFILGENGSGKSTLAKAILQLNKPLAGQILFEDGLKRNQIGYLPQQTPAQRDFPAAVWEIILSGGLNRGGLLPFYSKAEKKRAEELMRKLDLSPLADRCYRELSGGQQQRVLLARALMATGSLLLLDEPAAGLDPQATADLYELIHRLNQQEKITVLMISHDLAAAEAYAGSILHIGKESRFFPSAKDYFAKGGDQR